MEKGLGKMTNLKEDIERKKKRKTLKRGKCEKDDKENW